MKASMRDNPSFSSTLLDKIYRSIDDGETKTEDLRFYGETILRKQRLSSFQRTCLIEKWMEKKVSEKVNADKKHVFSDSEFVRKTHHKHEHGDDHDRDGVLFSSTSISSDSSSGGFSFSSSDTESMYCTKTQTPSCFVRPWPKPVKTRVSATAAEAQPDKPFKTEHRAAEKIHGDSNKAKQRPRQPPVSPGGRLASFINSLFTTSNTKKSRSSSSTPALSSTVSVASHKQKHHVSCSSASSFSRSCLSKCSPLTHEKLPDGAKRTVQFCPVSVIVDEDSRPRGQRETGKPPSRKYDQEIKFQTMERARRVEEMAREFLKEYKLYKEKNEFISRDSRINYVHHEDEDEDDVSSCSSSDLFELDHHVLSRNHRYEEELPVYETTRVETNRAIVMA
ncbi:Detected protein of unknown function [Hibiscus syriacus]|uniref:Protein BIG GRAIN 1-like A n=1 Tax=Hibiscus syriacus TaxID=106335 RepID=A0A6A3D7P4_HIBSY|nr:protein BIG GRAIN 1-like B [Hibiscus syriacus]KAE8735262.1 Detected protein of unknown function [Hibiscus syriacus]